VVDDELAAAVEELRQRLRALRALKCIWLVHAHPRQVAPLLAQLITQPRELLLLGEPRPPGLDPRFARHTLMSLHGHLSLSFDCSPPLTRIDDRPRVRRVVCLFVLPLHPSSSSIMANRSTCSCQYLL